MSCCYDADRPEFIHEDVVVARNPHICCECRRAIIPGESYVKVTGKWDGRFSSYKVCMKCEDLRHAIMEVSCASYTMLKIDYLEYLSEVGALVYDEDGKIIRPINHLTRPELIEHGHEIVK